MKQNSLSSKYLVFKEKHPKLHILNVFVSMFLPFCLLGLVFMIFEVVEGRDILGIYSIVGSLVLGIGLTLCVAFDYRKEHFWRVCVYPIAIGAVITVGNAFCAYSNKLETEFNEALLEFQLYCYISIFWFLVCYGLSREAITEHLSSKTHLNEEQLDDRKEGFFNWLWYSQIHNEFKIGWIYYFNVVCTVVNFLFFIATSILVLFKSVADIVITLGLLSAFLSITLDVFMLATAVKNKRSYYNRKKKGLLNKIPYSYEIGDIILVFVFVFLMVKSYTAL